MYIIMRRKVLRSMIYHPLYTVSLWNNVCNRRRWKLSISQDYLHHARVIDPLWKNKGYASLRKTPKRGSELSFLKSFQSQQVQAQYKQNKEIELENSNSGFIVVRYFLAYVHSPQYLNRVRVPLTWSFNQASNLLTFGFRL